MGIIGIFPSNTTTVQGIPIGRLNSIDNRVTKLEQGGGGSGVSPLTFTGAVDGSNTSFTPSGTVKLAIVDGGRIMAATSADGTVNWTGNIALSIAPNFDLILLG